MKKVTVAVFLLFVSITVFPETFNVLNEDRGLSSRRCYSVCQDENGFIWISTKLSIDRFDGREIVRYELLSPNQPSSDNIGFNFVKTDSNGWVWAFSQSGSIYKYNDKTDTFRFLYTIREHYQSDNIILNDIFFESETSLLLATAKGVLRLNIETGSTIVCDVMDGADVYHIAKQADNYYFSTKTGLYIVRFPGNNQGEIINHLLKNKFVNKVYYDSEHQQFWIGTFSDGMYILANRFISFPVQVLKDISKPIRSIVSYNETQLAIGIDGEGVLLVNRQTFEPENSFSYKEDSSYSLGGNSVWDLFVDSQQTLWAATYHEGVSYSEQSYLKFNSFLHENRNANSLSNNYVSTVFEDKDGDFWFGTNNGLSLLYRKTGVWKHFFQNKPEHKDVILTVNQSPDGRIWAGGYAFGLAEINKQNASVKRHHIGDKNPITGTEYVYSIYKEEHSDNLWIGGIYGKISCYNPTTGKNRFYDNESLRCFCSYNDSIIVLGLYRGVYLMNKNTGEKRQTKINAPVNHIEKVGDRVYWIGTMSNGLYYYDLKNDSLERYTKEKDGLSSNHVYSIEKDEESYLWISTEEGLNRFDSKTGFVTIFNKQDGLISNQFNQHASFRCSTNEMLFGTADGVVLFYPSKIKKTTEYKHYPLLFTSFQLFGNAVKPGEKDSPLDLPINKTEKVILPYNKNYFSLTFTLPNYQSSDKTEYSYLLKDYDLNWSKLSQNKTASYSKVQPGEYTFFVRAYIDKQLQEERSILFIVKQPWWNTKLARIIYLLFVAGIAYYLVKYFSERTRKKLAEEKVDFFINTAHDILTPLSLIESPLRDVSINENLTEESKYLLNTALNNTQKLNHFVHQLIDFQKIILNAERLVVAKQNVNIFFYNKINTYKVISSQKFISMNLYIPRSEKELFFDKDKLGKILDNLLSNAIKYTPYGGKIEISISFGENSWSFAVKDTGIGIPKSKQNLIFKHIFREENCTNATNAGSGTGLKMVSALVNIHHGKISFNSKKGEGSEFTVTLPYEYEQAAIDISPAVEMEPEKPSGTLKTNLFIVESDDELRTYLGSAFSTEYFVETYASGTDAFKNMSQLQPRIIIVGSLSDMDVISFCNKVKNNQNTSFISLLVITGLSDTEQLQNIFLSGATEIVKKPFDFEILSLKIKSLISLQEKWNEKGLADIRKNNVSEINNNRDQEFMDNLIQVIEQNLDNPQLNIAKLCQELGLSRTLLYNRITQLTNNSPNEFIRNIRLKNAANLLISGQYSVSEVANMVGIDNPKYFSRIFKEYYQVSPKNYAK